MSVFEIFGNKIPHFELQEGEKIWLQEAWSWLIANGAPPDYQTLRRRTIDRIGASFDANSINRLLLEERTVITFLGVLHIEPGSTIFQDADNLLYLIQKKLRKDEAENEIFLPDLAAELGLDIQYAKVIFPLLSKFKRLYNGANSRGEFRGKYDYDRYTFKSDDVFDNYMHFEGLLKMMDLYYAKIAINARPEIKNRLIGGKELWLGEDGQLHFSNMNIGIHGLVLSHNNRVFISASRIKELLDIKSNQFDFLKLLHLCMEINFNYMYENFYSVALLIRALIDHIPPIFNCKTFPEVANNYKSDKNAQSFKKAMTHLDHSLRSIGDSSIHSQIRKSETSPNDVQIDFKNDVDVLLGEIVRLLKV